MKKLYMIMTYGCQMNVHESEKVAGVLESLGFSETKEQKDADIIIFNTCCIRDNAEQKIFGNIGDVKKLKKANPDLIVGVVGCMTQQKDKAEELKSKFPYINVILGTDNLELLYDYLVKILDKRTKYIADINCDPIRQISESIPKFRTSGTNSWVNLIYGCNNFCTYCIVPYVRGRERSRSPILVLDEVKKALDSGYKEITLLGQNVDSYNYEGHNFEYILEEIAKIDQKFRLRFMTSHPKDFNKNIIDIIKDTPNICNNIHLPVQSGSNNILKLMNRKYTREHYLDLVNAIYEKIPNAGITSDMMVGFPYETEEDFMQTMDLAEKAQFSTAFTFVYSPRKGTPAAKMEQIPEDVKKDRIQRLVALQNNITKNISQTYLDTIQEVLVEDINSKYENIVCGRTDSGRLVNFEGNSSNIGEFVNVKITNTKSASLWGERV